MDFSFSVKGLIDGRKTTTSIWDKTRCVRLPAEERQKMKEVIDTFGWNSAQAQGLQRAVTDYSRLKTGDNTLILICKPHWVRGTRVIGGIKCGMKHLFFKKEQDFVEVEPMCVLDFFVHDKYQRKGFGYKLFQKFLKMTKEDPSTIAYDRPSSKMLAFLMKYYGCPQLVYSHLAQTCSSLQCSTGMTRSIQHNNNFAVFESFLENAKLRKVRLPGKKTGRTPHAASLPLSNQSSIRHDSLQSGSSIKESCTGTVSASSSIASNYSSLNGGRSSKASSTGARQKTPDLHSDRNLLKRLPGRLIDLPTKDPLICSNLSRTPVGPYPGFELRNFDNGDETKSSRDDENLMNKEPRSLTRLTLMESPFLKDNGRQTPSCVPPWATNLPTDKKGLPTMKMISPLPAVQTRQSTEAYQSYRRRSVTATGVKNCLQWGQG